MFSSLKGSIETKHNEHDQVNCICVFIPQRFDWNIYRFTAKKRINKSFHPSKVRLKLIYIPEDEISERICFHPSKVRLKRTQRRIEMVWEQKFSSLKGSIETNRKLIKFPQSKKFSSLKGSIETLRSEAPRFHHSQSFHPSKVRLKHILPRSTIYTHSQFSSLKGSIETISSVLGGIGSAVFSSLKGSIETLDLINFRQLDRLCFHPSKVRLKQKLR